MRAIGGYFELELRRGEEYHPDAIRLNTGRNALELILLLKKVRRVYIPQYTCETILEPFKKLGVDYALYSINEDLEPVFDFDAVLGDESFLYTNYFGVKDAFVSSLAVRCKNLIIDNTQAFYSYPMKGVDTFYSVRKFFGVPDGAYLYMKGIELADLPVDISMNRFAHLIERIEYGPHAGYQDFKTNDRSLIGQPIMQMSNLTRSLVRNIDYARAKRVRSQNYKMLHDNLRKLNTLNISVGSTSVPMVYPFLSSDPNLKQKLIDSGIFVATYWPHLLEVAGAGSIEQQLASRLVPLPVDQRYGLEDMQQIIERVQKE